MVDWIGVRERSQWKSVWCAYHVYWRMTCKSPPLPIFTLRQYGMPHLYNWIWKWNHSALLRLNSLGSEGGMNAKHEETQ